MLGINNVHLILLLTRLCEHSIQDSIFITSILNRNLNELNDANILIADLKKLIDEGLSPQDYLINCNTVWDLMFNIKSDWMKTTTVEAVDELRAMLYTSTSHYDINGLVKSKKVVKNKP
jgi:hypothetical protein